MQRPTILHEHTGRITLEYWQRNASEPTAFCQRPDGRTTLESPAVLAGWSERHDLRLRGYIHPPQSGAYVFTSSGNVELLLGEEDRESSNRQVLGADSSNVVEQQLSQLGGRATELLSKPLDAWDLNLRQEMTAVLENHGATPLSPRAKGWLLKQGLLAG